MATDKLEPPKTIGLVGGPWMGWRLWSKDTDTSEEGAVRYVLESEHLATISALEAENKRLREALEPFVRADTALGDEPGPFRFETRNGHRLIEREDFRRARDISRNRRETP